MKYFFVIGLILIVNHKQLFCQDVALKCKYSKNTIDEFSKKREVVTEAYYLYDKVDVNGTGITDLETSRFNISVRGCIFNGISILRFIIIYNNKGDIEIPKSIYILLKDETVVQFSGNWNEGSEKSITYYMIDIIDISSKDWENLKTQAVKKIRICFLNSTQKTFEVKNKHSNAIQNAIYCVDALEIPKPIEQIENGKQE